MSLMLGDIQIEQSANHPLVPGVMTFRFFLEELHAGLAQANGDFDPVFAKHQVRWRRERVPDHLDIDDRDVIERILRHLGLWQQGVRVTPARAPPEMAERVIEPCRDDPFPDYDTEPVMMHANG